MSFETGTSKVLSIPELLCLLGHPFLTLAPPAQVLPIPPHSADSLLLVPMGTGCPKELFFFFKFIDLEKKNALFYVLIHWLLLGCALTGDQTLQPWHIGMTNQLSYMARLCKKTCPMSSTPIFCTGSTWQYRGSYSRI